MCECQLVDTHAHDKPPVYLQHWKVPNDDRRDSSDISVLWPYAQVRFTLLCPMHVCLHTYYEYKEVVSVHQVRDVSVVVGRLSLRMSMEEYPPTSGTTSSS